MFFDLNKTTGSFNILIRLTEYSPKKYRGWYINKPYQTT